MKTLLITFLIFLALVLVAIPAVAQDSENVDMLGRIYNQWMTAYDITVRGDYAYVVTGVSGLQIVNISNIEAPEIVGFYDDNKDWVRNVALSGDYAFVTFGTDSAGLLVLDISDPANPENVSEYITAGYPNDIDVSGDYAYIANSGNDISELHIVNISNPEDPQETCVYEDLTSPNGITLDGDFAFVADYDGGLKILSISDVENIQEVGVSAAPQTAIGVFILDNYAYVSNSRNGLCIIDISDPENPDSIGSCATDGGLENIQVIGDYGYAALGRGGLAVINVSEPTAPEVIGIYEIPMGDVNDGFVTTQPDGFRLLPSYPNPFNAVTNISFELPFKSNVSINVCDLSGRTIANIFDGSKTVGIHSAIWDAKNNPSGVYLVSLEANDFNAEQRIMLIK